MSTIKPLVALVGRPNVGKSTLFNRITRTREALVDNMPGVTRDRHYGDAQWDGVDFTVLDTGGFIYDQADDFAQATPGVKVRFERVALETAHHIYQEQAVLMKNLAKQFENQVVPTEQCSLSKSM